MLMTTLSGSAVRSRKERIGGGWSTALPDGWSTAGRSTALAPVRHDRLLHFHRVVLAQRVAGEALVEEDRAQVVVAGELDAVHVVRFALHEPGRPVKPRERGHRRTLLGHLQLQPHPPVVRAAVEVV